MIAHKCEVLLAQKVELVVNGAQLARPTRRPNAYAHGLLLPLSCMVLLIVHELLPRLPPRFSGKHTAS